MGSTFRREVATSFGIVFLKAACPKLIAVEVGLGTLDILLGKIYPAVKDRVEAKHELDFIARKSTDAVLQLIDSDGGDHGDREAILSLLKNTLAHADISAETLVLCHLDSDALAKSLIAASSKDAELLGETAQPCWERAIRLAAKEIIENRSKLPGVLAHGLRVALLNIQQIEDELHTLQLLVQGLQKASVISDSEDYTVTLYRSCDGPLPESLLSQLLTLYEGALNAVDFPESWNTVEDMRDYLSDFQHEISGPESFELLTVVTFKGNAVSYAYGTLHEDTGIFALWYFVGAGNLRFSSDKGGAVKWDLGAQDLMDVYSRALLAKLLSYLVSQGSLKFLTYEVDAQTRLKSGRHARLKLFARQVGELMQWVASNEPRIDTEKFDSLAAYVPLFNYSIPHTRKISEENFEVSKRPYILVCAPLQQNLQDEFATGKVRTEVIREVHANLLAMYYDYLDPDWYKTRDVVNLSRELLMEFEEHYGGLHYLPVSTLNEFNRECERRNRVEKIIIPSRPKGA